MGELPDVPSLRVLEPPSGGLEALRDKLDTRRRARWLFAIPALAVAIMIAVHVLSNRPPTAAPVASRPATAIRDRSIGESFYWVASTPALPRHARFAVVSIDDVPIVEAYALP